MLKKPDAWGIPEAVEFQVLLLVELCLVIDGASQPAVDGLMARYRDFLSVRAPGGPVPLAERLGLRYRASIEFVALLTEFVRQELAASGGGAVRRDIDIPLSTRDRAGNTHHVDH